MRGGLLILGLVFYASVGEARKRLGPQDDFQFVEVRKTKSM